MKERPVIFNSEMVRAILNGRKTQTRRVIKNQRMGDCWSVKPAEVPLYERHSHDWWLPTGTKPYSALPVCPFGQVGDQLWVRETFMDLTGTGIEATTGKFEGFAYRADTSAGSYGDEVRKEYGLNWTPSLHMPRKACRILLEITAVRVERLNDISEEDAKAEGVRAIENNFGNGPAYCDYLLPNLDDAAEWYNRASDSFRSLWKSIYGAENWSANPWVWVIEFKRAEAQEKAQ
ncbi:hypothetical protein LG59_5093 [Serratia ureilytica]|uniref:hypothetical protein n=1 Tax=Serratia ureilytica TaxID=300181 RepID=UPI000627EEED|nr:hypothetical protein [Serratia ureilytica]KKO55869.1 hypothetical protein LG59_5040 [Serratia ureilytica]KKO59750.1 hypothetical protein LG59_5093 [Serratia ureilytica]